MSKCCHMAQLTWFWRPALTSGMEQISTPSQAQTGAGIVPRHPYFCQSSCLGFLLFCITRYLSCYRKKVLDFYQRACLSGYCSAFAYKPMQVSLSSQLNGKCVELAPGPCLFTGVELPSTTPIKHSSCRNSWSSDGTAYSYNSKESVLTGKL